MQTCVPSLAILRSIALHWALGGCLAALLLPDGPALLLLVVLPRATLVADMSTNKALLKKLEDTLLRELSNATGNILDNQELIATLESAKEKAVDISTKLTAAKATAADINEARVRYSSVATRGAVLFFVMAGLSAVNNMYEYSLAAFLKVFKQVGAPPPCSARKGCKQPAGRLKYILAGRTVTDVLHCISSWQQAELATFDQHIRCCALWCCSPCATASARLTWRAGWQPSPTPSQVTCTATPAWACLSDTSSCSASRWPSRSWRQDHSRWTHRCAGAVCLCHGAAGQHPEHLAGQQPHAGLTAQVGICS